MVIIGLRHPNLTEPESNSTSNTLTWDRINSCMHENSYFGVVVPFWKGPVVQTVPIRRVPSFRKENIAQPKRQHSVHEHSDD